ncbi:MAG: two-component system chemotaxis response regulator CheB [Pirellulaceae bacterium]|jgi:two-component system chemotaxis response regulator CheB
MTGQIRVLLCDDSAIMRKLIKKALEADPGITVAYEATNGRDAVTNLNRVKPDIVIMDVEMPVMDGIDAVREIRKYNWDTPIIMFSSLTSNGAEATFDALDAGANDFSAKPAGVGHVTEALQLVRHDLIPKIFQWVGKAKPASRNVDKKVEQLSGQQALFDGDVSIVAIGSSTGGPDALAVVLSNIPTPLSVPVVIAQHMPPVFTKLLAERLSSQTGHSVREATDGVEILSGSVILAPGDHHLVVQRNGLSVIGKLTKDAPENSCRPAVDPLFRSVAAVYGRRSLGVVLTGMGKDGTKGAQAIKSSGGKVIAQDKESSTVWGMPGQVVQEGHADRVLPLDQIAGAIIRSVTAKLATASVGSME